MPLHSLRRILRSLCLFACLAATPALAAPHPSLLFGAEDIPRIREHLNGPLRLIRDALEAGVHFPFVGDYPRTPDLHWRYFNDRRAIADSLLAFAFGATFLDPSTQVGREARELAYNYLTGICRYSDWVFPETQDGPDPDLNSAHFLFAVSMAYDWMYHSLPEAERQRCRNKVAVEGDKVYRAMLRNVWWMPDLLQNHNWINTASLGVAALAFEGELSGVNTNAWLEAVKDNLHKVHYILDQIEGGAWHEGTGYLNYGLDSLIPFSHALVRRKGGPDYADNTAVRDYPTLRRFMMPPAWAHRRGYVLWGDFSGLQNENTLLSVFYVARKERDGHAAWYAQQYLNGALAERDGFTTWPPGQRGMLIAAIFYDPSVPAVPPRAEAAGDLDFLAKDLSLWTSRSGWSDGGSLLALKNGVFGGHSSFNRLSQGDVWPGGSINFGHDHADDMGVHFFADGEWLTTRLPGYWIGRNNGAPEVNRTKYANSLLVDGRGQLGEGLRTCWMRSCPWFFDRIGTINHTGSTAHYSYALGAGSRLYPRDLGLQTFGRSVLFVERKIPVIRDVVRANTSRRFEIIYHAMDGVARDGDWLRLHAKNGRALGVKVVAPAAFEIRTENQSAVHSEKFDPDGSMTAVMIRPREQSAHTNFLTALVPVRAAQWGGGRPSIEAIDPAVPDKGLRIRGLAPDETLDVVFNEAPGDRSDARGLGVTGMAGVRKTRGGEIVRVMLAVGSRLEADGRTWIEVLADGPATVELDRSEHGLSVTGDEVPLRLYAPGVEEVRLNGRSVDFYRHGAHIHLLTDEEVGSEPGTGGTGGEEIPGGGPDDGQGGAGGSKPGEPDEGEGGTGGGWIGIGGSHGCGGCNAGHGGHGGEAGQGGAGGQGGDDGHGGDGPGGIGGQGGSAGEGGYAGEGHGGHGGEGGQGGSDGSAEPPGSGGSGGEVPGDGGSGGEAPGDGYPGAGGTGGATAQPPAKKKGFRCDAAGAAQASPMALALLSLVIGSRRRSSTEE